ncbi:VOC family protein [uncultured Planktomarina sp.]|uniref:VOC family protein n=1 Tax=uncultured Planktomarina sp. TaxID=1538529 RepID=UPI0032605B82
MSTLSRTIPTQGLHHVTLTGAGRQITLDFWEGVLGMPFIFEQPNLDNPDESHLYFDPGDDRLITVFCDETREPVPGKTPIVPGAVHHIAFSVSQAVSIHLPQKLDALGIAHSGLKDRGFMSSLYFREPLGLLIELASYKFTPPQGISHARVLFEAHKIRVAAGDAAIADRHVAEALGVLVHGQVPSLSDV